MQPFQIMYCSAVLSSHWWNVANVQFESSKVQTMAIALKFALGFQVSQ